jgi:hypothetical protein
VEIFVVQVDRRTVRFEQDRLRAVYLQWAILDRAFAAVQFHHCLLVAAHGKIAHALRHRNSAYEDMNKLDMRRGAAMLMIQDVILVIAMTNGTLHKRQDVRQKSADARNGGNGRRGK